MEKRKEKGKEREGKDRSSQSRDHCLKRERKKKKNQSTERYQIITTMGDSYVVALDVGTTNVRALLFDKQAGMFLYVINYN